MKKRAVFIFAFVLVIFISLYFDSEIVKGVSLIRNNLLNDFFMGMTFVSSEITVFFFLTILFLWKKKKFILPLWFTFCLAVAVSFLLKVAVQRQRPFQLGLISVLPVLEKTSYAVWNFSFPSFHTMFAFCAVPILSKEFPKFKYWWISFAILVGFSRIYFGLHFLSDVIMGGIIGYLLGIGIIKLEEKYKFCERIIKTN